EIDSCALLGVCNGARSQCQLHSHLSFSPVTTSGSVKKPKTKEGTQSPLCKGGRASRGGIYQRCGRAADIRQQYRFCYSTLFHPLPGDHFRDYFRSVSLAQPILRYRQTEALGRAFILSYQRPTFVQAGSRVNCPPWCAVSKPIKSIMSAIEKWPATHSRPCNPSLTSANLAT